MPGFGFSTPVVDRGWTMARVARIYDTLMRRLGYERYGIHGSDSGAMVARELGLLDPPGFLGAHVLHLFSFPSGDPAEFEKLGARGLRRPGTPQVVPVRRGLQRHQRLPPADRGRRALRLTRRAARVERAVQLVRQRHQPRDAATRSSPRSRLEWFTNTSATAGRYHYEEAHSAGSRASVSAARTGVAVFADDFQTIRAFAERDNTNIVHWSQFDRGGHYAAMEVPDVLAADIRTFFA